MRGVFDAFYWQEAALGSNHDAGIRKGVGKDNISLEADNLVIIGLFGLLLVFSGNQDTGGVDTIKWMFSVAVGLASLYFTLKQLGG